MHITPGAPSKDLNQRKTEECISKEQWEAEDEEQKEERNESALPSFSRGGGGHRAFFK